MVTFLMTLTDA